MTYNEAWLIAGAHAQAGRKCKLGKINGQWYVELN